MFISVIPAIGVETESWDMESYAAKKQIPNDIIHFDESVTPRVNTRTLPLLSTEIGTMPVPDVDSA